MLSATFFLTSLILFWFGTIIGSFVNVLVYRTIADENDSWAKGRSRCDHCHHPIAWFDLVPLFSYLWLRGKCRYCKKPIAMSHPVVEFLTGSLFVWWYWGGFFFFRLTQQPFSLVQPLFWLAVGLLLLAILIADLRYMIIPDSAVILLFGLTLLYRIALLLTGVMQPQDFFFSILAGVTCCALFFCLWFVTRGNGMGFGDVKFALPFGMLLGWPNAFVGLFLSFVIGGLVSLVLLVTRRKNLKQAIPFGPFLVLATVLTLVYGDSLWRWYSSLI